MSKLNLILLVILISLSTARAFAQEGVEFETNVMTEAEIDAELEELVDIKAIENVKFYPEEMAK